MNLETIENLYNEGQDTEEQERKVTIVSRGSSHPKTGPGYDLSLLLVHGLKRVT